MSVVKINVLEVPEGRGDVLEERFASRAGEVEKVDGFESFELLRPTEGIDRYLVVTRWRDEESFQGWLHSMAFEKGHARAGGDRKAADEGEAGGDHGEGGPAGHPDGGSGRDEAPQPAASGSELWGFEIVTSAVKQV